MDSVACDRLKRLSVALVGNNVTVPVAAAALEHDGGTLTAPSVGEQLGGRIPTNRIGVALAQLDRLGVLRELPYPGRPHARVYEKLDGPFWQFISDWALDPTVDVAEAHK